MQHQIHFRVEERSQVGAARRAAMELTTALQFGEEQAGKVALAVTECATNIVKHAASGDIVLRQVRGQGSTGLEILAFDKGPGIANLAACLRDGHSTSGTMGGGLGALSRLPGRFEVFTQPGKGTALRLEFWPAGLMPKPRPIEYGGLCMPKPGETLCGDGWAVELWRDHANVLLADGLGHGISAHEASRAATDALAANAQSDAQAVLQAAHGMLARTRGAAVAVSRLEAGAKRGVFASVGNVVGRVETPTTSRQLVSYNGIVGHTMRKLQEVPFAWPEGALLVMHSDGLGTHWQLRDYPGLAAKHPSLIAAVLYRDYDRGRDDASVVVMRNQGIAVEGS